MRTQVMQKQNSPLMQVWEREGPVCPTIGDSAEAASPWASPALGSTTNTPDTQREEQVGGWVAGVSLLLGTVTLCWAQPQST